MEDDALTAARHAVRTLADAWAAAPRRSDDDDVSVVALHNLARALTPDGSHIVTTLDALDALAHESPSSQVLALLAQARAAVAALPSGA